MILHCGCTHPTQKAPGHASRGFWLLVGMKAAQKPPRDLESSKDEHSVQAQSLEAGPQEPTWMAEREQTLLALLWWAQLETEHLMLLLAFLLSFMERFLLVLGCL